MESNIKCYKDFFAVIILNVSHVALCGGAGGDWLCNPVLTGRHMAGWMDGWSRGMLPPDVM